MIPYVELRCKSAFSFLTGTSLPEELCTRAATLGYNALALADHSGMYAAPRFDKAAKQAGLQPICGAEISVDGYPLLLLCETAAGYRSLCRLITREKMRPRAEGKAAQPLTLTDLEEYAPGLIALTGGGEGNIGAALDRNDPAAAQATLDTLRGIFGPKHLAVELQVHFDEQEDRRNATLCELARAYAVPLVLTNDVRMTDPDKLLLCDVLTCVREKVTLAAAGTHLLRNAERHLKSPAEMAALLPELPHAVAYSAELAARCRFTLAERNYKFPDFPLPPGDSQHDFLRAITFDAAPARFRPFTDRARAQLDRELLLIAKLGLSGYFLIVWDIIQFCKSRGILVQGRGSAANSAVCFALSITAADPLKMDLLFERFLSEERGEWPDIDLDLPSGNRREEVIQYLYRKYGAHGCALTANVITYRGRSAVRDIGKVLGLDNEVLDKLSAQLSRYEEPEAESATPTTPGTAETEEQTDSEPPTLARHLARAGLTPDDERVAQLVQVFDQIQDLPRHIGQHPGGMIIAAGRLDEVVPLQPATMAGRVVIQWDKEDCSDLGIVKIDLLGLGMMAALEEAGRLVPQHDGVPFDIAAIPEDDPVVYRQLQQADTIGVFQVESRAQMAILPRVQPSRFYDLVVQVGLIRPGPIIGKMVHPYLRRRCGQEAVTYPHPSLRPILERTLGIPLFQEQIMRVAMVAAGFTGGQAEQLRRAMDSKRSRAKMEALIVDLRCGMDRNGIDAAGQEQIVSAITSFAQYGFPESHAISFALLAYASSYLKGHHPTVFYTTLLNAWPMGFYHPATLVKDAQRHGVRVRPVEINASEWRCTIEPSESVVGNRPHHAVAAAEHRSPPLRQKPTALRIGLRFVRGLSHTAAQALIRARAAGAFRSIGDVQRRCPELSAAELTTLAEIGAFASLSENPTRRDALWQVSELVASRGGLLAGTHDEKERSPLPAMSLAERIQADYQGTSVTVGPHPVALCRDALRAQGIFSARELTAHPDGRLVRAAGLIIVRQRPATARGFFFMTLEDETGLVNLIVAPPVFEEYRSLLLAASGIFVEGQLQRLHDSVSIKGLHFRDLQSVLQGPAQAPTPLHAPSRNFH